MRAVNAKIVRLFCICIGHFRAQSLNLSLGALVLPDVNFQAYCQNFRRTAENLRGTADNDLGAFISKEKVKTLA